MNKNPGLVMAIVGVVLILINAIGYIFNLNIKSPTLVILGLVFLAVGMKILRD